GAAWAMAKTAHGAGALAVLLIEGQPVQEHALSFGPVQLPQGDEPFGTIGQLIRDTGRAAALPVGRPLLRQEQVKVDQGLVAAASNAQVNADQTILDLAQAATPLPLHAGGFVSLLGGGRLVNDADGAQVVGVIDPGQAGDDVALQPFADGLEGPGVVLEELLEGSHRLARLQGDRLGALARQVGEQPTDVSAE